MIKLVYCLKRRGEIDRAAFQAYWRTTHAPLVAAAAAALGVRRYVQSHTVSSPFFDELAAGRGCLPDAYDGVAELWWDDEAALQASFATAEGQRHGAILLADEGKFIDFAASRIFFTAEFVAVA